MRSWLHPEGKELKTVLYKTPASVQEDQEYPPLQGEGEGGDGVEAPLQGNEAE